MIALAFGHHPSNGLLVISSLTNVMSTIHRVNITLVSPPTSSLPYLSFNRILFIITTSLHFKPSSTPSPLLSQSFSHEIHLTSFSSNSWIPPPNVSTINHTSGLWHKHKRKSLCHLKLGFLILHLHSQFVFRDYLIRTFMTFISNHRTSHQHTLFPILHCVFVVTKMH